MQKNMLQRYKYTQIHLVDKCSCVCIVGVHTYQDIAFSTAIYASNAVIKLHNNSNKTHFFLQIYFFIFLG